MKILISIGVFFVSLVGAIFIVFGYNGISLFYANLQQDMIYYSGDNKDILVFNQALFDMKKGDYAGAFIGLDSQSGSVTHVNKRDYSELYGDLLYRNKASTGMVISVYNESLSYEDNERVNRKITFLSKMVANTGVSNNSFTGNLDKKDQNFLEGNNSVTGVLAREKKIEEIRKTQSNRTDSLDLNAGIIDNTTLIDSTLQVLDGGKEKRDW